jgi:hypothetical protein
MLPGIVSNKYWRSMRLGREADHSASSAEVLIGRPVSPLSKTSS